ncbi:MAG: pectin acetylesterase-family hydrolase [Nannocystaceae bacterium]
MPVPMSPNHPRLALALALAAATPACQPGEDDTSASAGSTSTSGGETTTGTTEGTTADTEGTATAGTDSDSDSDSDTGTTGPEIPPAYGEWLKKELPGTLCSNSTQYKFFVNYSETSDNLLIYLEPGGACWDYETCAGNSPLGAANPDGIPDSHMQKWGTLSPLMRRDVVDNPAKDWNLVFIPYCTGDVHTGNNEMTYDDPDGVHPPLHYLHHGHANIMATVAWLNTQFPKVGKMLLTGCSAGGAGAIINYYFFRNGISGVERGYLLDDSGPIYPSGGYSGPLHQKIRSSWDVDPIIATIPEGASIMADFGNLNVTLAETFPDDRLSTIYFQRDFNFSRYSYERFYPDPTKEKILEYWASDTQLLVDLYDQYENLAYYLPYWRAFNDSHCAAILTYEGSEIQELDMDLPKFIDELLDDDAPLQSYRESVQPGEDP